MIYRVGEITNVSNYPKGLIHHFDNTDIHKPYISVILPDGFCLYLQEILTNCGTLMLNGIQSCYYLPMDKVMDIAVRIADIGGYSAVMTTVAKTKGTLLSGSIAWYMNNRIGEMKKAGFKLLIGSKVYNKRSGNTLYTMLLDVDKYKKQQAKKEK